MGALSAKQWGCQAWLFLSERSSPASPQAGILRANRRLLSGASWLGNAISGERGSGRGVCRHRCWASQPRVAGWVRAETIGLLLLTGDCVGVWRQIPSFSTAVGCNRAGSFLPTCACPCSSLRPFGLWSSPACWASRRAYSLRLDRATPEHSSCCAAANRIVLMVFINRMISWEQIFLMGASLMSIWMQWFRTCDLKTKTVTHTLLLLMGTAAKPVFYLHLFLSQTSRDWANVLFTKLCFPQCDQVLNSMGIFSAWSVWLLAK